MGKTGPTKEFLLFVTEYILYSDKETTAVNAKEKGKQNLGKALTMILEINWFDDSIFRTLKELSSFTKYHTQEKTEVMGFNSVPLIQVGPER